MDHRKTVRALRAYMLATGMAATLAQLVGLRELLVVFAGNELTIGIVLAAWLLVLGAGAAAAGGVLRADPSARHLGQWLAGLAVALAVAVPAQVFAIRHARAWLGVPPGEYATPPAIAAAAALTLLPTCLAVGLALPLACRRMALAEPPSGGGHAAAAAAAYGWEGLGSMLGGLAAAWLLLPHLTPLRLALAGSAAALSAAAAAGASRAWRGAALAVALALAAAALGGPAWLVRAERRSDEARWRVLGVLPDAAPARTGTAVALVDSRDTVYQNLAVAAQAGQFTLYGNGEVMFVFPDAASAEHAVHGVMAQTPRARRVLLLGGNPVGDIPELLKYPLERLVYVEIDPGVGAAVRAALPEAFARVVGDPRVAVVAQDGVRYVQRCRETFDAVLVNAPAPSTAAANRYYTREFYVSVRRLLAPGGFVKASVVSSERLERAAAMLGASIDRTLRAVFPVVLVTAGQETVWLAGATAAPEGGGVDAAGLTLDRATLAARSRAAAVPATAFRPEYFLGADELDPAKRALVERRFAAADAQVNTILRPAAYFQQLVLWGEMAGTAGSRWLARLRGLHPVQAAAWLAGLAVLLPAIGAALRCRPPVDRLRARWPRALAGFQLATTGLAGMALNVVLVFVFQSLYGYVYARMGAIVAAFMGGLIAGAASGRALVLRAPWAALRALAGVDVLMLALTLAVAALVRLAAGAGGGAAAVPSEWLVYLAVAACGWCVGAEFPLANRVFVVAGGAPATAAALASASDSVGAAAGSLLVGVALLPVFGVPSTCLVLAALKLAGLGALAAAALCLPPVSRPARPDPVLPARG